MKHSVEARSQQALKHNQVDDQKKNESVYVLAWMLWKCGTPHPQMQLLSRAYSLSPKQASTSMYLKFVFSLRSLICYKTRQLTNKAFSETFQL